MAHHLLEAGSRVDARMLITYAKPAGDQAHALVAWSDSVRYYEAALRAAEALADSSLQEQAELYLQTGSAHYGNHDVGPALDQFAKATACYRELEDVSGLAQSLIWLVRLHKMYRTSMGELSPHAEELKSIIDAAGATDLGLRGYRMGFWLKDSDTQDSRRGRLNWPKTHWPQAIGYMMIGSARRPQILLAWST